uniref:CREG-like beta-barrel domain-containing protein n=1 Tax=Stomoxys calcitrans TaxID=35570 RepID=A0A1I8Q1L3_STOCA
MFSKILPVAALLALYINTVSAAVVTYKESNHALVARRLVHQTNWAAISTISTHRKLKDYPMVQILSINDYDAKKQSTGRIQFLLTNLDFTGKDVKQNNKVSLLFNDEQLLHCSEQNLDPMEPTCARTIISGEVKRVLRI